MTATSPTRASFVTPLFDAVPAPLRAWASDDTLKSGVEGFVDGLWERLDGRELAESFRGWCPIPGTEWQDYCTKLLVVDPGRKLLAGIRFRGGDPARAFVEVLADFPLTRPEDLAAIRRVLVPAFAAFTPPCFRLWFFVDPPLLRTEPAVCDQTYFVGRIGDLLAHPRPARTEEIELRIPSSMAFYPEFLRVYEALREASPGIAAEVRIESAEDLAVCLEAGLLFEAWVGDRWAGLIAADAEPFFGIEGFLVRDEILDSAFRGQGYGAALQRRLIERLGTYPDRLFFGTIHGVNQPSRRTALRNGRQPLFSSYFFGM